MQQWPIAEVLPQEHQEERLLEQSYQWFKCEHLEAPTPDRLTLSSEEQHGSPEVVMPVSYKVLPHWARASTTTLRRRAKKLPTVLVQC